MDWTLIKPPIEKEEEVMDWTTIEPPKIEPEFKLEKAPEEKKTFFSEIKKIFEAKPIEQIAKAQVSYNISQKTGVPIEEVHKNLDKVTKDLGIRGIPTSEEFLSTMFVFPVTAGLISNPITTGIGVTKFLALAEAENFAISKLKKWDYKFGGGKGLKELLPEETNQLTKDLVDVADFIGKGLIIAKTDPKLMKIWKSFTEKISTEYKMPEKMYISAEKIKSIFGTLHADKLSVEEYQLIRDLGLNASQYKNAIKKGIDIEIPASKITTITDKPYWSKIKGLFNIKSTSEIVVSRGGKVSPAKLMIEGKAEIPTIPIKVPEVKIPEVKPKVEILEVTEPIAKPKEMAIPAELEGLAEEAKVPLKNNDEYLYRKHDKLGLGSLINEGLKSKTPQEAATLARTKLTPEELLAWPPVSKEVWGGDTNITKAPRLFFVKNEDVPYEGELLLRVKKSIADKFKSKPLTEDINLPGDYFYQGKMSISPEVIEVKQGDKWIPLTDFYTQKAGEAIPTTKKPVVVEAPKTKEQLYSEKYGIPLDKVKITELPKTPEEIGEAETVSKLIKTGERLEEIPEPTKEDLEFIEKGFETSKEEFIAKIQADMGVELKPKGEEKLLTPEGTVTGEAGSIYIPSMAEVQNIGTKIASTLSIEAPFIKAGAKETGFQVKNYYGNIGLAHEQGLKLINDLNKFNLKSPTVKESGFKASGELDYTDITYLSERPGYFVKLSPEERKLASPAKKAYADFAKMWFDKVNEIGWLEEPFPKSLITRNNRTIGNLKASLPKLKNPEARIKVLAEINKLQDQIDRIKKQKIQFVSIPAKAILARADTDPALHAKIMSILPHWGRTTITVKDLVDAKIITRQEADIRYIIGEYSDRMGRKYALGKIFENAEKEGLIKSQAEKPDWPAAGIVINGQRVSIPQLRGKRLDPFFNDVITDFFSRGQVGIGRFPESILGITKMLQFYNPLFMPMYDVWQSAVTGTLVSPKAPKYIAQGIKDSFKKTDNYWLAYENGTFSKPFVIPYDKFEYQFTEAMKDNKLGDFIKKAALPTNWIPMLYTASWHTAWKLDETVRMMTFNYLQDQGMSDREAGQMAALFHSDYASVPPKTRKALNKVFFTPTFKITMGKLYLNMLKGGVEVLTKGKGATQSEKILARGALLALAGMMGISAYFKSQGYEEQEKFRKYVKTVETDEGLKENVITLANPFNIPWRYYYRVKNAFKPQTNNLAEKLLQTAKWDLHPIWRVASDVVDNYNYTVYNPYDDSDKIATDIGFYITGEIVKITDTLLESAKEGEIKASAFKALQKDLSQLEAIILKPFIFNYLREPKNVRKGWALQKGSQDFRRQNLVDPPKTPQEAYKRLLNYNQRMKEIMEDFQ